MSDKDLIISENQSLLLNLEALQKQLKILNEQNDAFRAELQKSMEKYDIEKFTFGDITITRVPEATVNRLNTQMLKAKYPEIADECTEETTRKGYITVRVK